MAMPTLLDIAKRNGSDSVAGLIDETTAAHPEVVNGFARTIKGYIFKTRVRTANPVVGFRNAGEGTAATVGKVKNRLIEAFIMNPRWVCDVALADMAEDGPEAMIAEEGIAMTGGSMTTLGSQFYYGTLADGSKGFPGLIAGYDATAMVVDAGGTAADTGSSVWAVRFGRQDVAWIWGNNGNLGLSDVRIESVLDANGDPFTAYVQELLARPGLMIGNRYSVGRIKKLTAEAGKTLNDAMLSNLLSKFPVGGLPHFWFMSRRSQQQLQASRTATNATGEAAPFPESAFKIPILTTDSIVDTESLTL